jgi:predicted PurR-regulated permease PerM
MTEVRSTIQADPEPAGPDTGGKDGAPDSPEEQSSDRPNLAQLINTFKGSVSMMQVAVVGIFVIALFFALDVGAGVIIPIVVAHLLDRLLSPVVRWMESVGLPAPAGAALVLLAFAGGVGGGAYYLSGPAMEWIETAPRHLQVAEYKLRGMTGALEKMQEAAEKAADAASVKEESSQQTVKVEQQTMGERLREQTLVFVSGLLITLFLLYFLLASGDMLLRKVVHLLPRFSHRRNAVRIVRRTENKLTHYLSTLVLINVGLGVAIAGGMYLVGMPNPLLWGALGGVLNFVPYLGPVVNIIIVSVVALVSFESVSYALLAPLVYLLINGIEGSLVTPAFVGYRLQLNPVVIFIALTFWGWLWGVIGALLAVPLLATFKIVCDSISLLRPISRLLGP